MRRITRRKRFARFSITMPGPILRQADALVRRGVAASRSELLRRGVALLWEAAQTDENTD